MPTRSQVEETVIQCVEIMIRYYRDGEGAVRRQERMLAEVRAQAAWISEWHWELERIAREVIKPVSVALCGRYGDEVGPKLVMEFLLAFSFEGIGSP